MQPGSRNPFGAAFPPAYPVYPSPETVVSKALEYTDQLREEVE